MSNETQPAWLLSEEQVFEWLKSEPRTYKWQVMVALDREKTNQLLQQEYIDRYARNLYFDPITRSVEISDTGTLTWEYLYDHVLGPPRLSFENSNMNALARLTMPVLGGIQMTVEQAGMAPKQVTSISWYDPLQSPKLICEIRLEDTSGEVNSSREVSIDLALGTQFRLTFASTYQSQVKGGSFYQEIFEKLDPEKKRFVLSKLSDFQDGALLEPDKFRLRALSAQPARAGEAEGASEGAILLFIGTKGHEAGNTPDKDAKWIYPIPEGRSSTLLVANDLIVDSILRRGVGFAEVEGPEFQVEESGGVITAISVVKGVAHPERFDVQMPGEGENLIFDFTGTYLLLKGGDHPSHYTIRKDGEDIRMSWALPFESEGSNWVRGDSRNPLYRGYYFVKFDASSRYRFVLDEEGQSVVLGLAESELISVELDEWDISEMLRPYLSKYAPMVEAFVSESLLDIQRKVAEAFGELEVFRMYGLLFTGNQVVQQRNVRFPCDLAVFGDISPTRTAFQLDPIQADVIHGGQIQFKVSPAQTGLTWTLDAVPGYSDALGSITQAGGYTAPAADEIPPSHAYTMVRVTAQKGELMSSALVRVMRRSVVVNPMVVSASQNVKKVRFSGGALGGGKLEWSLETKTGARLMATPPEEDAAVFDEADMFYVPGTGSTGDVFSIETIKVKDASGNTASADLVLTEKEYIGRVTIKDVAGLPEGKVQLQLEGAKEPMTSDADWKVISGGGTVDENGLFTVDTDSPYKYAVVTGTYISPVVDFFGYIILPVPLVDLDEIKRALGSS